MKISEINFLIIGAAKSATTWLQQSLQQNPVVYMPDPELHYFSRNFDKGDDWYASQFHPNDKQVCIGEKSNSYLDTPNVADRIHKALPKARLIAQLRNPVDRAYSDYCMLYRRGEVGKDIEQHLDPRYAHGKRFLNGGLYEQQLNAYLDLYPPDQLLVMFFEDVKTDALGQLELVKEFLQIPTDLPLAQVTKKVKDKTQTMVSPALGNLVRPLKPIIAPFRDTKAFQYVRGVLAHEIKYVPLSEDMRKRMADYYAPEVQRLEKIVGKDLTNWLRG